MVTLNFLGYYNPYFSVTTISTGFESSVSFAAASFIFGELLFSAYEIKSVAPKLYLADSSGVKLESAFSLRNSPSKLYVINLCGSLIINVRWAGSTYTFLRRVN